MSVTRGVVYAYSRGNKSNLLRAADGSQTGTSCLSDTLDLYRRGMGLIIHAAGAVALVSPDESADTGEVFPGLAVGIVHPIAFRRIKTTGTTVAAANITILYGKY